MSGELEQSQYKHSFAPASLNAAAQAEAVAPRGEYVINQHTLWPLIRSVCRMAKASATLWRRALASCRRDALGMNTPDHAVLVEWQA